MSNAVSRTLRKTFAVAPGGRVKLRADRGSIRIETGNREDVEVEVVRQVRTSDPVQAERMLDRADVRFSLDGTELCVDCRWDLDDGGPEVGVQISMSVPLRFHLDLATCGGDIEVSDLDGDMAAVARGGSLRLGRVRGSVQAEAAGGGVLVGGCSGAARIRCRGGGIRLDDAGDTVDLTSEGGSISARLSATPGQGGQLSATGGSLEVLVPASAGLDVDAAVVGGRIQSDLPITPTGPVHARTFAGPINGGGPKLALRAVGGNVSLKAG
jgi:hypothetical protein